MQNDEFQFMLDKFSTSIAATLQLKKTLLFEIVKQAEGKISFGNDKISAEDFVTFMKIAFNELARVLNDINERISFLSIGVKSQMLPSFIMPGQTFLGKFFIQNVISYKEILDQELFSKGISVFANMKPLQLN